MAGMSGFYDVFVSHAGESKPFAGYLSHELGGELGRKRLRLTSFLDRTALKAGGHADEKMRAALESARVGVVVLDRHFLMKDWPMRELRALMARDRALPVLYTISYEEFKDLVEEHAKEEDKAMLKDLTRITMIKSDTKNPVEYDMVELNQRICFSVLRRLKQLCEDYEVAASPSDVLFVMRVRDAVRRMFEGESAMDYDHTIAKDKQEAEEWLKELDVQIKRMNQKRMDKRIPDARTAEKDEHLKNSRERIRQLNTEYNSADNHRHLRVLKAAKEAMDEAWPQGMWTMPAAAADPIWAAMRELGAFWKNVQSMYQAQELLELNEDPRFPDGFFNKQWTGRGREYRELVEPLDIANWYWKNKHVEALKRHPEWKSGHYVDFPDGTELGELSLLDNERRPGRFILIQRMENQVFGAESVRPSLTKGYDFKKLLGHKRWQDVLQKGS